MPGQNYFATVKLRTGRALRIPVLIPYIDMLPDELITRIFQIAREETQCPHQQRWRLLGVSRRFRALTRTVTF